MMRVRRYTGAAVAQGEIIAFASVDTRPTFGWLSDRLEVHREGYDLVGGSILNGTPGHWIGTASYLLEYSALLPVRRLLEQQGIPHAVSFQQSVFANVGLYPEDLLTGEDTIFNRRCLAAGLRVGFAPAAGLFHENPTRLREYLNHAANHGRGLAQCIDEHNLGAAIGPSDAQSLSRAVLSGLRYTVLGLFAKYQRLARFAPRQLPALLATTPLIVLAQLATAWGALSELRSKAG